MYGVLQAMWGVAGRPGQGAGGSADSAESVLVGSFSVCFCLKLHWGAQRCVGRLHWHPHTDALERSQLAVHSNFKGARQWVVQAG